MIWKMQRGYYWKQKGKSLEDEVDLRKASFHWKHRISTLIKPMQSHPRNYELKLKCTPDTRQSRASRDFAGRMPNLFI